MKKQKMYVCMVLSLLIILSACASFSNSSATSLQCIPQEGSSHSIISGENVETIDETEYYKVICSDFMYYYYIYDEDCDLVKSGGPLSKQPRISIVNDLVKFTIQSGTGLGTQWGFYYHTKKDVFSRVFECIYDQCDEKVAFGSMEKVVVRDIFDKTQYYLEIADFKEPFSEMIEPITDVKFIDGGTCLEVTYFTGSSYQKVIEVLRID